MVEKYDIKINLTQDIALNVKINSEMNHEEFLGFLQQIEGLFKPFVKQQMNYGFTTPEPIQQKPHKKGDGDRVGLGQDMIKKYAPKVIALMEKERVTATEAFRRLTGTIPTGGEYVFMRQCGIRIGGKFSGQNVVSTIPPKKTRKEHEFNPEFREWMKKRMGIINAKTSEIRQQFPEKDITSVRKEAVEYFENVVKPTMPKPLTKKELTDKIDKGEEKLEKKKFNEMPDNVEEAFKMFGG